MVNGYFIYKTLNVVQWRRWGIDAGLPGRKAQLKERILFEMKTQLRVFVFTIWGYYIPGLSIPSN